MFNDLHTLYSNHKLDIETVSLIFACVYMGIAWHKETHITLAYFTGMIGAIAVDIFVLQGDRPWWGWVLLNCFFWLVLYEKFLKKTTLVFLKRVSVWLLMFLGDDLFRAD